MFSGGPGTTAAEVSAISEVEGGEEVWGLVGVTEGPGATEPGDGGRQGVVSEPGPHLAGLQVAAPQGWMDDHHGDPVVGAAIVFIPGDDDCHAARVEAEESSGCHTVVLICRGSGTPGRQRLRQRGEG